MTEQKTPEEWSKRYNLRVMDADGWRQPGDPSWDTPITEEDFIERMSRSTIIRR